MTTSNGAQDQYVERKVSEFRTELQNSEPAEIEALLPWYAVGTLSRAERQRVEDALRSDAELTRHADLVREELAATIGLNETLGAPSAGALDRLMAAIDAEAPAAPKRNSARAVAGRFADYVASFSPRTLAVAGALAAVAIVLQASMLIGLMTKPQAGVYRTASVGSRLHLQGTFALVRFARQASAAEITKFLETYKATLVDGPKPGGLYRVRLSLKALAHEEIGRIVSRMHQEPVVEFVQLTTPSDQPGASEVQ